MTEVFDVGDLVRARCVFTDEDGVAVTPTTVVCKYQDGAGTETTPTPTLDSVGRYHVDLSIANAGVHHVRFNGTGALQAAVETSFTVRSTVF